MANPIPLKVKFKSANLDDFIERYSVDMSRAGIFIRSKKTVPVGTPVRFEFTLQDESALLQGEGSVAWNREPDESRPASGSPGIGIKFEKVAAASQEAMDRIVAAKEHRTDGTVESRYDAGLREFLAPAESVGEQEDTETRTPIPSPAPGLARAAPADFHEEPATRVMQQDQALRLVEASRGEAARARQAAPAIPVVPPAAVVVPASVAAAPPALPVQVAAPVAVESRDEPPPLPPPPIPTAHFELATDAVETGVAALGPTAHVEAAPLQPPPGAVPEAAPIVTPMHDEPPSPAIASAVAEPPAGTVTTATEAVSASSEESAASASLPVSSAISAVAADTEQASADKETTLPPLTEVPDTVASSLRLPAEGLPAPPPIETAKAAAAAILGADVPPLSADEGATPLLEERPAAATPARPEVKATRAEPEAPIVVSSPAASSTPSATKRRSPLVAIAGAAILIGGAVALYPRFFSSSGTETASPAPAPAPTLAVVNSAPAVPPPAPEPVAPEGATIDVLLDSIPPGASTVIDGKPVGVTPIRVPMTGDKPHEVFFALKGFQGARQTVTAKAGAVARVELAEAPHFVDITTTPSGAEVKLDGKGAGKTGSKPLHIRLHEVAKTVKLTIAHKGFTLDERTISLTDPFETHTEGEVLPLSITLISDKGGAVAAPSTDAAAAKPGKKGRHRRRGGAN